MKIKRIYETKYKKLLLIPIILLVLAAIQIGVQTSITGDFVNKGVSLKGGSTITISKPIDIDATQRILNENHPNKEFTVRSTSEAGRVTGAIIETDAQTNKEVNTIKNTLSKIGLNQEEYTVELIGSSLGNSFFKETTIALLIAFLFMGIIVALYFRTPIPSLAVILAALSDIVITLAIFNLTGQKLGTAGIAAFLMLIGYSVDTDILLTTRLLKRHEGIINDRVYEAMKTGLTMTLTTLTAVTVAFVFAKSQVIKQIMLILLIGLLVDVINTWIQNVGILKWYLEKK